VVLLILVQSARQNKAGASWDSASGALPVRPTGPASQDLDAIRELDPEFSAVLFEDFVYALYAKAQEARNDPQALAALAPYLDEPVRQHLASRPPIGTRVSNTIVGAMRVLQVSVPRQGVGADGGGSRVIVRLEFEANVTLGDRAAQYVVERWRLVRGAAVLSKPPAEVRSFHCPNCGAPASPKGGDRCEYCGEVTSGGRFDWSVAAVEGYEAEDRPPALGGTAQEEGTDHPTVFHPAAAARRADLLRDDPATTDEAVVARLELIYGELNAAWSNLDLAPVRPYVSDGLFDYLQYWIDAYRRQGLRNVLEGMRITQLALVKVVRDRHYDALTFRIWGAGRDSTVREQDGVLIGGNPRADRVYSEYWTLIRGAAVRGTPRTDKSCPNCGAPLDVNMAGRCTHCDAKVTRGEFDWVLSKIEQDDSYSG
jgi:predicted lipid-binding transport protein (Tim44 family)